MTKYYARALSIAGFDGSGGAGLQADLKTFSAIGCYGTTVLTALPIQNTMGVSAIHDFPAEWIKEQLESVLDDVGTDVIKIGMVQRSDIIMALTNILKNHPTTPIICDPVMIAKSGDSLLNENAISCMVEHLFPLSFIITPNLPEAEALVGYAIISDEDIIRAAKDLSKKGPKVVIIKGGHAENSTMCRDYVYSCEEDHSFWMESPRIATKNTHGTGCSFSAAIAAYIALKYPTEKAIRHAKDYLFHALKEGAGYTIGKGQGPVHHFYNQWN